MGLLHRLFGGRIDPEAVAPAAFAALPVSWAEFGRRLHLRLLYSPHPGHLTDTALVHRAMLLCPGIGGPGQLWDPAFHRFRPLCLRLPTAVAGPAPVWVRDFAFPRAQLPPDFTRDESCHPYWLEDTGGPEGRFLEQPAATPGARARQRLRLARRRQARQVRAVLVQANLHLFSPGREDLPCLVVFSFDDRAKDRQLAEVAERVFAYKNTEPEDPELAFVAALTTDERFVYYQRDRLPRRLTGGLDAYTGHLYVHRPFLPEGYLEGRQVLRCLAEPGERGMLELLPDSGEA